MTLTLEGLPFDILFGIVKYLEFDDFFNLRRQCKQLKSLLSEKTICRMVLETHIYHTTEAKLSRDIGKRMISCQKALDRAYARREAFALAQPVSISLLGYGAMFLYQQGVLCYWVNEPTVAIRVLDVHNSSDVESVIGVANLIGHTVEGDAQYRRGTFTLLNYADGILVCLFEARKLEPWLLVIRVSTGYCLAAPELETSQRIFARHNSDYLLFGTHSHTGSRGHREWVISGYNLKDIRQFENKIYLENLYRPGNKTSINTVVSGETEYMDAGHWRTYLALWHKAVASSPEGEAKKYIKIWKEDLQLWGTCDEDVLSVSGECLHWLFIPISPGKTAMSTGFEIRMIRALQGSVRTVNWQAYAIKIRNKTGLDLRWQLHVSRLPVLGAAAINVPIAPIAPDEEASHARRSYRNCGLFVCRIHSGGGEDGCKTRYVPGYGGQFGGVDI
ncbi:hypothetical protein GP486_001034 [Trichoglossum hirsutum]|uniref:F-box domain-containing protein n=1 Tax=Trichoglossum hirsutum TaxID=265104 RepID=A0A9P8LHF4_9PEZI|nr:hypothetical protein GP486_001034 [Trichoglossum hirsutum]